MTDIGRLKELEAKATITPWDVIMPLHKLDAVKIVGAIDGDADDDGRPRLSSTDICEMSDVPSEVDNALFIVKLRNAAPSLLSEIETLRAENERLKAALQPFADIADKPSPPLSDYHRVSISLGDCRRAASALAAYDQGKVT